MVINILVAIMGCLVLVLLIGLLFFKGPFAEDNIEEMICRVYENTITTAREKANLYQNAYEDLCKKYNKLLDKYEELYKQKGE